MSGGRIVATFLPLSWLCWGIGHLAGVPDGSNTSGAIGWIGGLALSSVVLSNRVRYEVWIRRRLRVRRWRSAAIHLALSNPTLYQLILTGASDNLETARLAAVDPVAHVALFLAAAADYLQAVRELPTYHPSPPSGCIRHDRLLRQSPVVGLLPPEAAPKVIGR